MENSPTSHFISNLSKRFQNVFMVSIASLKPSSMQYDVHLGHFGLPDSICDDKAGYALGRGYVVIDRLIDSPVQERGQIDCMEIAVNLFHTDSFLRSFVVIFSRNS